VRLLPSRGSHAILHSLFLFFLIRPQPPSSTLFPYTTLFRSLKSMINNNLSSSNNSISSALFAISTIFNTCSFLVIYTSILLIYRSEEHTSELQSRFDLVCRLLLEKKKKKLVFGMLVVKNFNL